MEQLVKEIARACGQVFAAAGTGLGRTASVSGRWTAPSSKGKEKAMETFRTRERTVIEVGGPFLRGRGLSAPTGRRCDAICAGVGPATGRPSGAPWVSVMAAIYTGTHGGCCSVPVADAVSHWDPAW